MKSKFLFFILVIVLMLVSCSDKEPNVEQTNQTTLQEAEIIVSTAQSTEHVTPEPTATPESEPEKPKYIFIVIGDGFGRGAMTLGEIYARLENEDMDMGAAWEGFEYQSYVEGMGESASGGTAIASGVKTDPWYIGKDIDGNELYTIMDRAKANGYATGVVTNSYITDATPATFMTHVRSRYSWTSIALQFAQSNVDYIAGGGMIHTMSENTSGFTGVDCIGLTPDLSGPDDAIPALIDAGYETYFGLDGAVSVLSSIDTNSFTAEKSINLFSGGQLPYDYYKYNSNGSDYYDNVPSLIDMTEAGVQSLSQNQKGFVMMIESALIDKSGHKFSQEMGVYEVAALNELMIYLMEFYNQYPDETLIILTADHETGNYTHNDDLLDEWKAGKVFTWTDDGNKMADFVNNEWRLSSYNANLQSKINVALSEPWDTIEENRAQLYTALTLDVCTKYGTQIRTADHSDQLVPLYVMGNEHEAFAGSTHIKEIPITICEIMEWEALPELLPVGN